MSCKAPTTISLSQSHGGQQSAVKTAPLYCSRSNEECQSPVFSTTQPKTPQHRSPPLSPRPILKKTRTRTPSKPQMHHRVSFHLQPRTPSPAPKRLHMHPLLLVASTPSHRAPITYDVRYVPSSRGVGEGLLNQPATDPPTYTGLQVVIEVAQMRWKWALTVYPPFSPVFSSMPISNLHLLMSIHAFLATPLTYADWLPLGPQQQRIVTEAYEARCRMSQEQSKRLSKGRNHEDTMVGGWLEGARRMDCLGGKTCLVGVKSDRWGTLRLSLA